MDYHTMFMVSWLSVCAVGSFQQPSRIPTPPLDRQIEIEPRFSVCHPPGIVCIMLAH
jgi:hypothetical protein